MGKKSREKKLRREGIPLMAEQQRPKNELIAVNQEFSGPIPPPHLLSQYDQVVPGAAERILAMAERQSAHRLDLERRVIVSDIKKSEKGQWFALFAASLALVFAFTLGMTDHQIAAGIIGGLDIVSLATVFVFGRKQKRDEREAMRGK